MADDELAGHWGAGRTHGGPRDPGRREGLRAREQPGAVVGLLALGVAVMLTGGAKSPILPILVVPPMAAALAGARARLVTFGALGLVVLAYAWELLSTAPLAPVPRYSTALLTAVTGLAGTQVVRSARRRLELGREEGRELHAGAVRAVSQRHADLVGVAGALAHQLKNPLAAVQGLATLLEKRAGGDPALLDLARDARALNVAVNELLDFSRPASESSLKRIPIGPEVERLAREVGAELELRDEATAAVLAEPRKLARVLSTLLGVASKGGARVRVAVVRRGAEVVTELTSDAPAGGGRALRMARILAEQHGARLEEQEGPGLSFTLAWAAPPEPERT